MRKVYFHTNCCAVQRNETYRISKFFMLNGWTETLDGKDADICVETTCGVTNEVEAVSIDNIISLRKDVSENCLIVVSGCLPNICYDKIKNIDSKIEVIPLTEIEKFDKLIGAKISIKDVYYNVNPISYQSEGDPNISNKNKYYNEYKIAKFLSLKFNDDRFLDSFKYTTQGFYLWKDDEIFEIKISSGCNRNCSYCASRIGVGKYKSKSLNNILIELKEGIKLGYKKIMFMGDELGDYGCDIGVNLLDLLEMCFEYASDIKIGLRYLHPQSYNLMYDDLKKYFKNIFYVCLSVQSASPKVLREMNRPNNISETRDKIVCMKEEYPNMYIHTQIIVGFPTEEEIDFQQTCTFLEECGFDFIRYNRFSPRKGTEAFGIDRANTDEQIDARMAVLKEFCRSNRVKRLQGRYHYILNELMRNEL